MISVLIVKLLRDLRWPLLIVALLLFAFECLWVKITQRITQEVLPGVLEEIPFSKLLEIVFEGPGKLVQQLIGGSTIDLRKPLDVLTIGYVEPVPLTILCVWAIGRAAGAITGEIDRGTMELLLAQPLSRTKIVLAHICVDLLVIPILCLAMWAGTWLGVVCFGKIGSPEEMPSRVSTAKLSDLLSASDKEKKTAKSRPPMWMDPMVVAPALPNVAALVFAIGGYTLWFSARGRFRGRVMGVAVVVTLLQYMINVIGQLWPAVEPLRPFTIFYYYQPQQIILQHRWSVDLAKVWYLERSLNVNVLVVLTIVGVIGYGLALWTFQRRDVPAPL